MDLAFAFACLLCAALVVVWRMAERDAARESARADQATNERDQYAADCSAQDLTIRHLRERCTRYSHELDGLVQATRPAPTTWADRMLRDIAALPTTEDR